MFIVLRTNFYKFPLYIRFTSYVSSIFVILVGITMGCTMQITHDPGPRFFFVYYSVNLEHRTALNVYL